MYVSQFYFMSGNVCRTVEAEVNDFFTPGNRHTSSVGILMWGLGQSNEGLRVFVASLPLRAPQASNSSRGGLPLLCAKHQAWSTRQFLVFPFYTLSFQQLLYTCTTEGVFLHVLAPAPAVDCCSTLCEVYDGTRAFLTSRQLQP